MVASILVTTECVLKPLKHQDKHLRSMYMALFNETVGIATVAVDTSIAYRAAELRAIYGLRTPDAIHVATAIIEGCDAFLQTISV